MCCIAKDTVNTLKSTCIHILHTPAHIGMLPAGDLLYIATSTVCGAYQDGNYSFAVSTFFTWFYGFFSPKSLFYGFINYENYELALFSSAVLQILSFESSVLLFIIVGSLRICAICIQLYRHSLITHFTESESAISLIFVSFKTVWNEILWFGSWFLCDVVLRFCHAFFTVLLFLEFLSQ